MTGISKTCINMYCIPLLYICMAETLPMRQKTSMNWSNNQSVHHPLPHSLPVPWPSGISILGNIASCLSSLIVLNNQMVQLFNYSITNCLEVPSILDVRRTFIYLDLEQPPTSGGCMLYIIFHKCLSILNIKTTRGCL